MTNSQSRPGTKSFASLVVGLSVGLGVVGCSSHPTTSGSISTGETTSSVAARQLVDVEAVWQSEPLPPCTDYLGSDLTVPPGLSVPNHDSVAKTLAGVQSPGILEWVKTKLGWLDKALSETRAGVIASAGTAGAKAQAQDFQRYVEHVRDELQSGHDITSDLDSTFIERCL
ncbi:Uncharacterised protein [Mycobacteroides abscessus subsp. abscessus]|uniref:hypothetical protein n=1 Tax=Mycobacteroides abscessus TaxID=36809 RepID=UPI00092CCF95|nr:hypothetical protein [Mycobacteroides abscessus]MBE5451221.1 hypothetical protein [Mycobacteroides abscessus]SHW53017.1 Uncharacterised protein [Mycobacteroides abscessus subsp. abscessus]SHX58338.1 Uncharacterised protein [Mycobacteroides abscessus subsp. abscessus]SIE78620.1 Uncharacterised protein [Mycobacteroides abscessus subsp. abscessus]SII21806.1 Uncharacterised protein [Mycobacteroides abscessus subsp. abscessus]